VNGYVGVFAYQIIPTPTLYYLFYCKNYMSIAMTGTKKITAQKKGLISFFLFTLLSIQVLTVNNVFSQSTSCVAPAKNGSMITGRKSVI
jgi:hypothetical protein